MDAQPVYDMGVNDQKNRLEAIKITENGTYSREDGYNEIEVEVPDLNGSYDEGYSDGYNTGYGEGEQVSYQNGYNDGYNTAGSEIAETAQVLNITENGVYATDFSKNEDYVINGQPTGDDFYGYAELKDIVYDTKVVPNIDTKLELWYKGDDTKTDDGWNVVIGSDRDSSDNSFNLTYNASNNDKMRVRIGKSYLDFPIDYDLSWLHFEISREGVYVNGEYKGSIDVSNFAEQGSLYINASPYRTTTRKANGTFGMIKITTDGVENVIIPTNDGFLNTTTNEMLDIIVDGGYSYGNFLNKKSEEGNLIRTVNVNITPSIKFVEYGLKCSYSTFKTLPSWIDLNGVIDCSYMFSDSKIEEVPYFDTSNTTNMSKMFQNCYKLTEVPLYNTKNCKNLSSMFSNANKLQTIPNFEIGTDVDLTEFVYACTSLTSFPALDTKGAINMQGMFYNCTSLTEIPALDASGIKISSYNSASLFGYNELKSITKAGGLLNLRRKIDDSYGWVKTPNLDYESCINILNGLYDFIGNGVTPSSNEGKLKVHQNFLNLVGDQISIGTNKGWTITT